MGSISFTNKQVNEFWGFVRKAADYYKRAEEEDRYYAQGYCGGCETCLRIGGTPPKGVRLEELEDILNGFYKLFKDIKRDNGVLNEIFKPQSN